MKMSLPFQPCSSMCISGQTGSGKTRFVYRFLTHLDAMYGGAPPKNILYCYGIHQPLFDDMERKFINLKLHHGLPSTEAIDEQTLERQHALIVLDDLIQSGAEYRHGGIIYPRLSPPTTQCNLHYIKLISPRFEIENYRFCVMKITLSRRW